MTVTIKTIDGNNAQYQVEDKYQKISIIKDFRCGDLVSVETSKTEVYLKPANIVSMIFSDDIGGKK